MVARSTRRRCPRRTGPRASRACRSIASRWPTCSTRPARRWSATRRTRPTSTCRCGSPSSAGRPGSTAGRGSTTPAATSATPATTSRRSRVVPRGAKSWFHSKYAVTDGVSIGWYRKMYYLNYLGGASAIYWEQSLDNQWMLPGPGTHPIQLSPFGRATEDFQAFVDRLPDRGEPFTPVGILLSYGHGYERVNYSCKMLHVFPEDDGRPRAARAVQRLLAPGRRGRGPAGRPGRAEPAERRATATSSTCWSIGRRGPRRSSTTRSSGPPATWTWRARGRSVLRGVRARAAARWS